MKIDSPDDDAKTLEGIKDFLGGIDESLRNIYASADRSTDIALIAMADNLSVAAEKVRESIILPVDKLLHVAVSAWWAADRFRQLTPDEVPVNPSMFVNELIFRATRFLHFTAAPRTDILGSFFARDVELQHSFERHISFHKHEKIIAGLVKSSDTLHSRVGGLESEVESRLTKLNSDIADRIEAIDKLYGIAAGKSVTTTFATDAAADLRRADKFRIAAIVVLSLAATMVFANLALMLFPALRTWLAIDTSFATIESLVSRVLSAVLLTLPAWYLARESSKHRAQAHEYKFTSLNHAALDALLVTVEDPLKSELKAYVIRAMFAAKSGASSWLDPAPVNLESLLAELLKQVGRNAASTK